MKFKLEVAGRIASSESSSWESKHQQQLINRVDAACVKIIQSGINP